MLVLMFSAVHAADLLASVDASQDLAAALAKLGQKGSAGAAVTSNRPSVSLSSCGLRVSP
jgi:hypothetical protein